MPLKPKDSRFIIQPKWTAKTADVLERNIPRFNQPIIPIGTTVRSDPVMRNEAKPYINPVLKRLPIG